MARMAVLHRIGTIACTSGQLHLLAPGQPAPLVLRVRPGKLWVMVRGDDYRNLILSWDPDSSCQAPCDASVLGPIPMDDAQGGFAGVVSSGYGPTDVEDKASCAWLDVLEAEPGGALPPKGRVPLLLWDGSLVSNHAGFTGDRDCRSISTWQGGFLLTWNQVPGVNRSLQVFAPAASEAPDTLRVCWA